MARKNPSSPSPRRLSNRSAIPSLAPQPAPPGWLLCPFTILIDTREQSPYTFETIQADAAQRRLPIKVNTAKVGLPTGDYSLLGYANRVIVERKSKADLYGSVGKRKNFEERLARMSEFEHAAVIVEAEFSEIRTRPPAFTRLEPKSLCRTLLAWSQRYPVEWWLMPGREAAEQWTFRYLERFWKDHREVDGLIETLGPLES